MSAPEIKPAGALDVALLAELNARCFAVAAGEVTAGTPWSARSLAEVMALPGVFGLLALSEGAPVGFLLAQVLFEEAELLTLGVLAERRREGHGRGLLQAALDEASHRGAARMQLEVAENNLSAQALYRSAGFLPAGRRRNYYHQSEGAALDAVIFARGLESGLPDAVFQEL